MKWIQRNCRKSNRTQIKRKIEEEEEEEEENTNNSMANMQ